MSNHNMQKTLKSIPLYEGLYSIDILKNVYSHITNKYLKPFKTGFGEIDVKLCKEGKYVSHKIDDLFLITHRPEKVTAKILERFERKAISKIATQMAKEKRIFTPESIRLIRERYSAREVTIYDLCDELDVVYSTILNIVTFQTYRDIV